MRQAFGAKLLRQMGRGERSERSAMMRRPVLLGGALSEASVDHRTEINERWLPKSAERG
jgi:hypothetical protein